MVMQAYSQLAIRQVAPSSPQLSDKQVGGVIRGCSGNVSSHFGRHLRALH